MLDFLPVIYSKLSTEKKGGGDTRFVNNVIYNSFRYKHDAEAYVKITHEVLSFSVYR